MKVLQRTAMFAYGLLSYAVFLATALYAVGFIGGFLVPTTLDGAPRLPFWDALLVDTLLLGLFAVQHSVMARPGFKRIRVCHDGIHPHRDPVRGARPDGRAWRGLPPLPRSRADAAAAAVRTHARTRERLARAVTDRCEMLRL